MTKNHGKSIKDDEKYEALRDEGYSKSKAAAIANAGESASEKGGFFVISKKLKAEEIRGINSQSVKICVQIPHQDDPEK